MMELRNPFANIFIHIGERCPICGMIGDKAKVEGLSFFRCPRCETEFTKEMILSLGKEMEHSKNN